MKTFVTVAWAVTVAVDVDPEKMESGDEVYMYELRYEARSLAASSLVLNLHDSMITDCEDFPQLVE